MAVEYGLRISVLRVVRCGSRSEAEHELARHPHAELVSRQIGEWGTVKPCGHCVDGIIDEGVDGLRRCKNH